VLLSVTPTDTIETPPRWLPRPAPDSWSLLAS